MTNVQSRDPVIDAARGLAILLVIFGHALEIFIFKRGPEDFSSDAETIYRLIYSFHMPLFYFVSGLVSTSLPKKTLRTVLASSGALIFLALLSHILFIPAQIFSHASTERILLPLVTWSWFNILTPWFLISLAVVRLWGWVYLKGGFYRRFMIAFFLCVTWIICSRLNVQIFQMQTWAPGFFFFLIGNKSVCVLSAVKKFRKTSAIVIAVSAFLVVTATYNLNIGGLDPVIASPQNDSNHHLFCVYFISGYFGNPFYLCLTAIFGIIGIIMIAVFLQQTTIEEYLADVGRKTLALLILNGAILVLAQPALRWFLPVYPILIIVAICMAWMALQIFILPIIAVPIENLRRFLTNKILSF